MSATEEASQVVCPKGYVEGKSPGGDRIFVPAPREKGPWFRVKHPVYGHEIIKAKTAEDAVAQFVRIQTGLSDADVAKQVAAQCRVGKAYD